MTYPIYLTNGTLLLDLNADAVDQSTSLTLIGRGVTGYGEAWNDNFVHVLENAASATAPTAPLVGQLWFNTSTHVLEVWKGPTGPWSGLAYASQIPSITTGATGPTGPAGLTGPTGHIGSTGPTGAGIGTVYPFFIPDMVGVTPGATVTTSAITVACSSGTAVPITCSGGGSATISVNGGSYTTATTILNGQSFTVRLVASSSYLTPITAFITAGGGTAAVSATCTVWTADAPAVPMRIALTGNTTYYVNSTTGNDSNIGTSTAPWLTLTHANSYISNNIDLVGYTVTINYNGSVYSTVTSNTPSITYGFGTTPTAPVALNVGERATITFSSASTIPLNIATATGGGIYRMNMVVTANNTSDSNWLLKPNNTTYAVSSFSSSGLEVGDGAVTAFGSATTLNTYTKLTTSPYVGNIAQSWTQVGGATTSIAFFFDLFAGPGTSDHVNGIGASISEFLVSTYTVAKMLKHSGGIMGGSSLSFSIWNDTTTAWTSLGTLVDMNGTSLSGTIIVERLA